MLPRIFSLLLVIFLLSAEAFSAGYLRSERKMVFVDAIIIHGRIIKIDNFAAIPGNAKVALKFNQLENKTAYNCDVVFFEGMTGSFSGTTGRVSRVQMVYDMKNCTPVTSRR